MRRKRNQGTFQRGRFSRRGFLAAAAAASGLARCDWMTAAERTTAEVIVGAQAFRPGELWPDNNGVPINAHGGGILVHKKTFYWFGQHMIEGDAGNYVQVGVHVYSSKDLYNWKDEGIALRVTAPAT